MGFGVSKVASVRKAKDERQVLDTRLVIEDLDLAEAVRLSAEQNERSIPQEIRYHLRHIYFPKE
jgi:hypothetical protein